MKWIDSDNYEGDDRRVQLERRDKETSTFLKWVVAVMTSIIIALTATWAKRMDSLVSTITSQLIFIAQDVAVLKERTREYRKAQ